MRLQTKIILLVTGIAFVVGVLCSLIAGSLMRSAMESELQEEGTAIARTFAGLITNTVMHREVLPTHEAIHDIATRLRDVEYIYVIGFDGALFTHTFEQGFPRGLAEGLGEKLPGDTAVFRRYRTDLGPILEIGQSLVPGMRARIYIGMNRSPIDRRIAHIYERIIGATVAVVLLSLAVGIVLSRRITKPLDQLAASMDAFGRGQRTKQLLATSGGREVAQLTRSFNRMIEERTRIDEALQQSVEKYRDLFENANDAIFIVDDRFRYRDVNRKAEELLGYSREELLAMGIFDLIPPDQRPRSQEELERLRSRGSYEKFQGKIRTKDGRWLDVEVNSSAIVADGRFIGSRDILRDITDRTRAEEALRESEQRYRLLFENNPFPMWVYDLETLAFLAVNDAAISHYGYARGEFLSMTLKDIRPPEDVPALLENIAKVTEGIDRAGVWRHRKKDGAVIEVEITSHTLIFSGRQAEVVLANDVTDKRRMQEEIMRSQKLESLGILAGGIAHDFNNLLTAILGNLSLALLSLQPGEEAAKRLQDMEKAATRAQDLTRQLLTFSRGGAPVKKTVSLAQLIRDASVFSLRGSSTRCEFGIPEDLWPVDADEGQVSQVINNLVINASQAMPGGGSIRIRAANVALGPADVPTLSGGRYIRIDVEDEGTGIPREHLEKIFDPYFTTKPGGTGLGLATSYSIIKKHGGHITLQSEFGKGSTFTFYLPASDRPLREPPGASEGAQAASGGAARGRVLVMDDEEMIRDVAGSILRRLGYEVRYAGNGAEAITAYTQARESGSPFDLVIMDLTVPGGMGGRETIRRLREIDPGAKAIVSSGYSNDPIMAEYARYGFQGVVAKPYTVQALEEAVRQVIGAGTAQK